MHRASGGANAGEKWSAQALSRSIYIFRCEPSRVQTIATAVAMQRVLHTCPLLTLTPTEHREQSGHLCGGILYYAPAGTDCWPLGSRKSRLMGFQRRRHGICPRPQSRRWWSDCSLDNAQHCGCVPLLREIFNPFCKKKMELCFSYTRIIESECFFFKFRTG
jgi:hypothetical protein